MFDKIPASIKELISYILMFIVASFVPHIKERYTQYKYNKAHRGQFIIDVFSKMVELRTLTESNRAYTFIRHNGIKAVNGKGLDKISMVYESVDESTRSTKEESQNMPLHMFEEKVILCDTQGHLVINVEKLTESFLKRDLIKKGVIILIIAPYRKNQANIPEGYVGISYTNEADVNKELIQTVKDFANEVGYILRKS